MQIRYGSAGRHSAALYFPSLLPPAPLRLSTQAASSSRTFSESLANPESILGSFAPANRRPVRFLSTIAASAAQKLPHFVFDDPRPRRETESEAGNAKAASSARLTAPERPQQNPQHCRRPPFDDETQRHAGIFSRMVSATRRSSRSPEKMNDLHGTSCNEGSADHGLVDAGSSRLPPMTSNVGRFPAVKFCRATNRSIGLSAARIRCRSPPF